MIATSPLLEDLAEARERTLAIVSHLTDSDLESVHNPIMSPLVWDLAHIAAYEDLWIGARLGGGALLRPELAAMYDAFETPRAVRGDLPLLDRAGAIAYMQAVRERSAAVIERHDGDGTLVELVLRHEHQHNETMLQAMSLAGLLPDRPPRPARDGRPAPTGLESVEVPGGPCTIGAAAGGFAYDNERPRHTVDVPAFRIGRHAVTNATWMHFVEGGGYVRREWWSDEGWAWKQDYDITHPGGWTDGTGSGCVPEEPAVHVSWFEADAFARAHGARLPTEIEWEKAATWDQQTGDRRPLPAAHANLDHGGFGPAPAGAYPEGAAPCGALGMLGDVWEWTSSSFRGYDGFRADPYPEYSEVFFGDRYKVLRGGSWATRTRVACATFRNWDLPQRRQIFSGFRLAWDA